MKLQDLIAQNRNIRVIGFDDAPHRHLAVGNPVEVAGVVCANTRFEGMVWGELGKDGMDSTDAIARMVASSKFHEQLHLVLLDGITFGGSNVVDLAELSSRLDLPVAAVMRRPPRMSKFRGVLSRLPEPDERLRRADAAGTIHTHSDFIFQVAGETPEHIGPALVRLTDRGKVPEALRLAHLIGAAVITGQSSNRA